MKTMVVAALLAAGAAAHEPLPLRHGFYVAAGAACRDPANAVLRDYDGHGLGSSKAGQCRSIAVRRHGRTYDLRQSCAQYGAMSDAAPKRADERHTVRIDGPAAYTDLATGTRYRLCPGLRL